MQQPQYIQEQQMETKETKKVVRVAPVPAQWNPYRQSIAEAFVRSGAVIADAINPWLATVRATEQTKVLKNLEDRKAELRKSIGAFADGIAAAIPDASASFARNLANDLRVALITGSEYRSGAAMARSRAMAKKGGSAKKAGTVKATTWQALLSTLEKAQEQCALLKGGKGLEKSIQSLITRVTAKVPE